MIGGIGVFARLALLMAVLWAISALQLMRTGVGTGVLLAGGALLLTGIFAGKLSAHLGLPRLTGYLLIGIIVGPYVLGFIPSRGVAGLELVKGLAVSLIALAAGAELHLGLIRRVGAKVMRVCLLVCSVVLVLSMAVTIALKPVLPLLHGMSFPQMLGASAILASMVASFSPTVTIAIVQETKARGDFTEFLMALVIIGDLFVMVTFALAAGLTKASFGGTFELGVLAGGIGWELFGSVLFGAAIGLLALLYLKKIGREVALFVTGLCFVLAEAGIHLHLSPLLLALAAGALIANLDERVAGKLHQAIEQAGLPVFALFFAAAGAGLQLDLLLSIGPVALALAAIRAMAIYLSCRKFAPPEGRIRRYLWMGLISQAGVTFGLAALVARGFPGFGPSMEALVIAMVTVNQLIGPLLTRRALFQAGDIHAPEHGASRA